MKMKYGSLLLLAICLNACTSYTFDAVFPSFYDYGKEENGLLQPENIPDELISSLPTNFQLAYYSGHLWCYVDWDGEVKLFKWNPRIQKAKFGPAFRDRLKQAQRDEDFLVFTPIAYPNVYCVIPSDPIDSLFNETYFASWLDYLDQWQTRQLELDSLDATYKALVISTDAVSRQILATNERINDYTVRIDQTRSNTRAVLAEANQKRAALGLPLITDLEFFHLDPGLGPVSDPPPFNLKIPYEKKRDPFVDVIMEHTQDVSDKPWATEEMSFKNLNADLANKIQEVNDKFSNPSSISDPTLAKDVAELKAAGFQGIRVSSGARTPLKQADLYSKKGSNSNPVGRYTKSNHMFGQAADMKLPEGWGWGSSNHNKLRSVMQKMGLNLGVPGDPVHFTLSAPSSSYWTARLAMARAYAAKARSIKNAQAGAKDDVIFNAGKVAAEKDQLERDLSDRVAELESKASLFQKVSAKYSEAQKGLADANAEIARRAAEAAARERDRARRDREGHEHPDRPGPRGNASSPSKERSANERPTRERQSEPPQRERFRIP